MSGHVGDLSPKQAAALEELCERIKDVYAQLPNQSDNYLLRWLR
ncbi:SEC14-like protein 2, partial [Silurus asotus]